MPEILIRRPHHLPLDKARAAAERLATQLKEEFNLSYEWSKNTLRFQRTGIAGEFVLQAGEAYIQVTLSFLLFALKSTIEAKIHRHFDETFGR